MPRVGFEPTISAGERPKTYALDRAATGTGNTKQLVQNIVRIKFWRKKLKVNAGYVNNMMKNIDHLISGCPILAKKE